MSAEIIQAKDDELTNIARQFGRQAEATTQLQKRLEHSLQSLQSGWQGKGSAAFFAEMNGKVLPVLKRLGSALQQAQRTTSELQQIVKAADEDAAKPFKGGTKNQVSLAGTSASDKSEGFFGKALGFVGDLFKGAGSELVDMVKGIGHLIAHPIDTAKGLWYGINHPGELWDAFKKPFVDDWESGHPGKAIGRGLMFVGSLLLGTKGADKALKAIRVGKVAGEAGELGKVGEVAGTAGKLGEAGEVAGTTGKIGEVAGTTGKVGEAAGVAAKAGELIVPAGRTLSAGEQVIADMLVKEGRVVEALAESTAQGVRTSDFLVDGVRTELKTVSKIEGTTVDKMSGSLGRRILDGAGQGKHIIADVTSQPGITQEIAERAVRRAYGAERINAAKLGVPPRIEQIRIIGPDFDIVRPFVP